MMVFMALLMFLFFFASLDLLERWAFQTLPFLDLPRQTFFVKGFSSNSKLIDRSQVFHLRFWGSKPSRGIYHICLWIKRLKRLGVHPGREVLIHRAPFWGRLHNVVPDLTNGLLDFVHF